LLAVAPVSQADTGATISGTITIPPWEFGDLFDSNPMVEVCAVPAPGAELTCTSEGVTITTILDVIFIPGSYDSPATTTVISITSTTINGVFGTTSNSTSFDTPDGPPADPVEGTTTYSAEVDPGGQYAVYGVGSGYQQSWLGGFIGQPSGDVSTIPTVTVVPVPAAGGDVTGQDFTLAPQAIITIEADPLNGVPDKTYQICEVVDGATTNCQTDPVGDNSTWWARVTPGSVLVANVSAPGYLCTWYGGLGQTTCQYDPASSGIQTIQAPGPAQVSATLHIQLVPVSTPTTPPPTAPGSNSPGSSTRPPGSITTGGTVDHGIPWAALCVVMLGGTIMIGAMSFRRREVR